MSVSIEYQALICELLNDFEPLRIRWMFGGAGIYAGELFFAVLADDTLYLKADDGNRPDFERLGLEPFRYTRRDGRTATMGYYPLPAAALDDAQALRPWVQGALAAARRAARTR
jgi:DNA transformation protein and related proteins